MNNMFIDQILPPLICRFVNCRDIWMAETKRRLSSLHSRNLTQSRNAAEIRFESCPAFDEVQDLSHFRAGSVAIIEVTPDRIESTMPLIYELYRKDVLVGVIGQPAMHSCRTSFQAAGAVCLVTNLFGCERLASMIDQAARSMPSVNADWRRRFLDRIPWESV